MLKTSRYFYILLLLYSITNLAVARRDSTPEPKRLALTKRQRTKAKRALTILSTTIKRKPHHPRAPFWLESHGNWERKLGLPPNQKLSLLVATQQRRVNKS